MNVDEMIPIKPEAVAELEQLREDADAAHTAFEKAAKWIRHSEQQYWKCIRSAHPELEDYEFSYNAKLGQIKIIGKRRL